MSANISAPESRYERKFVLDYEQALGLSRLISSHPAHFRKTFPDRQVNNIYYDTSDFAHYRENIAGVSPRKKVRIRWYGNFSASAEKNVLEIKSKDGEAVTKSAFEVSGEIKNSKTLSDIKSSGQSLRDSIYHPVLKNSYLRQYYVTADNRVRLTIDQQLKFGGTAGQDLLAPEKRLKHTIIELKYSLEDEEAASEISKFFPFRLSKSSKYEQGVSLCYPHLVVI